jgi:hypothetical protein
MGQLATWLLHLVCVCITSQIEGLRTRLDGWVDKVSSAALTLESKAVGIAQTG